MLKWSHVNGMSGTFCELVLAECAAIKWKPEIPSVKRFLFCPDTDLNISHQYLRGLQLNDSLVRSGPARMLNIFISSDKKTP